MIGPDGVIETLDPVALQVSRPLVLLRLGYRQASQVPDKTRRLLDEVISQAEPLLAPRAVHVTLGVAAGPDGGAVIAGTAFRPSHSLAERLQGCTRAILFAATIGEAIEAWVREAGDSGQMSKALLADAYGSSAAIALGLALESFAGRRLAALGLHATRRHAPGYADWDLADQRPLLERLDAGRIGITLTEDHLMLPAKSISGLIGGR